MTAAYTGSFEVRAKKSSKTVQDTPFDVFEIEMRGTIESPISMDGYPYYALVHLADISDGQPDNHPVLCMIEDLQSDEGIFFEYRSDVQYLPYAHSVIGSWVPVITVPIDFLVFPRTGRRALEFHVILVCGLTDKIMEQARCLLTHTNSESGYLDIAENRSKAEERSIHLFMAVSAADGDLDRTEADCVKDWIKKRIAMADSEADEKRRLNSAVNDATQRLNSRGGIHLHGLCRELVDLIPIAERYDVLEVCIRVAGADNTAKDEELRLLESVAAWLELDSNRFRAMTDKILPVSMHEQDAMDVERLLGMDPSSTTEEKKRHLRNEYSKWNGRVTHSDAKVRQQATKMLQMIAEERSRLDRAG